MPTLGVIAVISPLSMAGTSNAFQQNNMLQDRGWMGEGGVKRHMEFQQNSTCCRIRASATTFLPTCEQ